MRRFNYNALVDRTWDTDLLNLVAIIHEYKGRQVLFARQKPVELERLTEIARIQSTEASNKIEGIVTTGTRMKQLFAEKTTPRNRDEDEIMGYRDVLNTIHESSDFIPLRSNYILQLHRDLFKRSGRSFGGKSRTISMKRIRTGRLSQDLRRLRPTKRRRQWRPSALPMPGRKPARGWMR